MKNDQSDIEVLAQAFEALNRTTQSMEAAYRALQDRVDALDQELAQKNRELAFTSDYLASLLESMSDGVIAVDPDGIVTRFNRAAGIILGYQAGETVGRPFEDVFGRPFPAPRMPGAMELRAKSGRMVPADERDSEVSGQDGRRLGSVKTFQDLSELIALREQVRQIDRLAAIGEMAATVAHEIRNPLGGIRGFAAFLAQDIPADDPKRRLVEKIEEGARNLDKVVNELLEYTRPVELSLQPTLCREVVESALAYFEYDGGRIALANHADCALRVWGDAGQLRQVLLNVLLNAAQSIDGKGEITITTGEEDQQVCLSVADTGCGMNEEQREKVFSPFFTTKEKGTGLGMAVSAKIVEGHGGSIEAESEAGKGTTIRILLPRAE